MKTDELNLEAFLRVSESETDVFSELVALSGLNPKTDFQHSRLAEVDFKGSDLSQFNFDYADLRRANWQSRRSDPSSFRWSLRGNGTAEVRGTDFADLTNQLQSRSRWAERFFAFQILIDNWGENNETFEVLNEILISDSGTYLRLCSFVYFTSSYLNNNDGKELCVSMANSGGSKLNMFRLSKLRNIADMNMSHLKNSLKLRYPGDLTRADVGRLFLVVTGLPDIFGSTDATHLD